MHKHKHVVKSRVRSFVGLKIENHTIKWLEQRKKRKTNAHTHIHPHSHCADKIADGTRELAKEKQDTSRSETEINEEQTK